MTGIDEGVLNALPKKMEEGELMEKDRALNLLQNGLLLQVHGAYHDALKMAIEVLQKDPCEDVVSRRAVQKQIDELLGGHLYDKDRRKVECMKREICDLPSVTPTIAKMEQVEDCISRQALMDEINSLSVSVGGKDVFGEYAKGSVLRIIDEQTPVAPQKVGKWIFHKSFDNGHENCNECIECSQCHTWLGHDCYAKTPYCPMCGAKMEEGE